jgi:hypothetical protein
MSENLKLVLSNDLYYLTSDEPINCHDLVFDGVDVFLYEDNRSLLGLKKVLANEFDLGFVSIVLSIGYNVIRLCVCCV